MLSGFELYPRWVPLKREFRRRQEQIATKKSVHMFVLL